MDNSGFSHRGTAFFACCVISALLATFFAVCLEFLSKCVFVLCLLQNEHQCFVVFNLVFPCATRPGTAAVRPKMTASIDAGMPPLNSHSVRKVRIDMSEG